MGKFNLKDQLAGIAALIAAIVAIGGGFVKYGEITTKLEAISEPDLTPLAQTIGNVNAGMAKNQTNIAVMQKEIELLKLQLEEIKVSTSNPLSQ